MPCIKNIKKLEDTVIQSSSPFFDRLSAFVEGVVELVEFRRPKESCSLGHSLFVSSTLAFLPLLNLKEDGKEKKMETE